MIFDNQKILVLPYRVVERELVAYIFLRRRVLQNLCSWRHEGRGLLDIMHGRTEVV